MIDIKEFRSWYQHCQRNIVQVPVRFAIATASSVVIYCGYINSKDAIFQWRGSHGKI